MKKKKLFLHTNTNTTIQINIGADISDVILMNVSVHFYDFVLKPLKYTSKLTHITHTVCTFDRFPYIYIYMTRFVLFLPQYTYYTHCLCSNEFR